MAYNVISSFIWGTKPKIPMSISYDRKRVNADMQYRIKVVVSPVNGESYFGYPIYLGIKLDNVSKVSEYTLKTAYPSTWNSNITYESAWITLSNKTTGTTALSVNIYSGFGSVRNATYNYDLVVDPCISLMNVSNGTLGTAQTISVTRYNSTFKHTIEYSCGSASGTIAEKSTSTSISWNPSVDLAQQNTTGSSVSITLKITTFNGSVTIGSSEKTIICAIPNSVVPTISGITATENVSGIATKFGSFVQWKSKLNVSVSSAGSQGSTIKSITTTICGVDYSGASFVSEALTESGSVNIVTKVTDSRERSATFTKTITVSAYTSPVIESLEVYRIDASGNPDDEGSGIAIKTKYSIAPVGNKNTHAYGIEYKLPSSESYTSLGTGTAGYSTDTTYSLPTASISPDNAYIIRFRIQDYFNTVYYSFELPTAYTTFDVNASGKGVAFGKVSEKNGLEIDMIPYFFTGFGATTLAENDDLNDILTVGKYVVNSTAKAATISNIPEARAGSMWVIPILKPSMKTITKASEYLIEIYVTALSRVYIRHVYTSGSATNIVYGAWKTIV